MLTDMTVEEEFELKEEEPWYDKQDLENDLHLAAELGKTLLERNRELETALKTMYSTNQDQLQEIEYLSKQVELLREVNDQHARVYEQLDQSAREVEQNNHRLVQENRSAQHNIQELTQTVDSLQSQVEELQSQLETLQSAPAPAPPPRRPPAASWRLQSLEETQLFTSYADALSDDLVSPSELLWHEAEQTSLRQSLRSLQTQLANERTRREEAERDADLLANENASLEQRLGVMKGYQARLVELESEAEELRLLWRSDHASHAARADALMSASAFFPADEESGTEEAEAAEVKCHAGDTSPPPRGSTGGQRSSAGGGAERRDHERSCVRRSEVVKRRGISLLNEVDAQYSALQLKYDALLRRCHQGEPEPGETERTHRAVQTPVTAGAPPLTLAARTPPSPTVGAPPFPPAASTAGTETEEGFQQPEYKALFKEIFTCIQKTKEDLSENRCEAWLDEE